MKSHFYISIFLFLIFASCASTKTRSTLSLTPSLYVNGKAFNSAIVNYEADYGYDRPDGDVRMGEIEIRITDLIEKSQKLQIAGNLTGIYINEPNLKMGNAPIKLLDGQKNVLREFKADSVGSFDLKFSYQTGYLLEFNYIGYRTLFVDISKLVSKV